MTKTPIVYVAFANDKDDHLDLLKQESSDIKNALNDANLKGWIILDRDESLEQNDLKRIVTGNYDDRIIIFHYGGHAGSTLFLDSGEKVDIVPILAGQKNLKLVFLNGCSTKQQVDKLFKAGIKAVIATSVPIGDSNAREFAKVFYDALASQKTIKRAFIAAKSNINSKVDNIPTFGGKDGISRGVGSLTHSSSDSPWTLYVQEQYQDEILEYILPSSPPTSTPANLGGYKKSTNEYIKTVLDEMCKYNKEIGVKREALDASKHLDLIIEYFPWIIGSQISLLRNDEYSSENNNRLKQLISTYIVSSQLVYYILLSDLWEKRKKKKEAIKLDKDFLTKNSITNIDDVLQYNYFDSALEIFHIFKNSNLELFIPELKKVLEEYADSNSGFHKAISSLQETRESLFRDKPKTDHNFAKTESALSNLLKKLAFFANYTMLSVRNINIENPRAAMEVEYELDMGKLNANAVNSLTIYNNLENRRKKVYSDCRSIILLSINNEVNDFLNLSPFIIDKNSYFITGNPNLIDPYLYMFEKTSDDKKEGKKFHYFALKHNIEIALKNEKGTDMIHTKMTDKDFDTGQNINENEKEVFEWEEKPSSTAEETSEGLAIFSPLEIQFERMKSILTPNENIK